MTGNRDAVVAVDNDESVSPEPVQITVRQACPPKTGRDKGDEVRRATRAREPGEPGSTHAGTRE